MSVVHEESTFTYAESRDKVELDLPDNSVKEHLSIVNCGHDVGSGRSVMDGQKETSAYTYVEMRDKVEPDLPDYSVKEHLSIVYCGHDVGSGRSAMEGQKDYPRILRLQHYLLDTWPTITIELVNLFITMVGNDSRSVASERTIFVEIVKGLGSMQRDIGQGQTIRILQVLPTRILNWMLSNTTMTRKHERSVLPIDVPPVPCQACPRIQTTFPHKWQVRTAHQSNEKIYATTTPLSS